MNAIFLLIIIIGISAQHVTTKAYNAKAKGVYSFSTGKSLAALIVFLITAGRGR